VQYFIPGIFVYIYTTCHTVTSEETYGVFQPYIVHPDLRRLKLETLALTTIRQYKTF